MKKELQTFVTNNVFFDKKSKNTTTTKQKIEHKTLAGAGNRASCTQSGCVTTAPPSQLRVTTVNKLFLTVSTQWVET